MFSPEKPIETQSQDLLGRYGFARAISSAISEYQFEDSIVIGLYGKWGTGKSSLINLIVEDMKKVDEDKKQDEKNIIIHFNPWNYSDQNQLTIQFFNTLSSSLRLPCHAKDAIRAGEKLEIYAKFFQPLSLFSQVSVLPILFSKIFGSVGKASKKWGESHKKSLYETKMELNRHLVKLKSKIIIVIDDIDRLNNNEIRQMFQLIKSLGDSQILCIWLLLIKM
jgi:predicted KAP-like P-loop ATPase